MMQIRQNGASLIEFVVLTILILIFITVTIDRVWDLRIAAERNNVESLLGTLRSSLGIELSVNVLRKKDKRTLSSYNHCNPMAFLDPSHIPSDYLGEYSVQPEEPVIGEWYFNRRDGTLEYRLRFPGSVKNSSTIDPALLRFQVQLAYRDLNNNGHYDPGMDIASGINIVSLQTYHWKEQSK